MRAGTILRAGPGTATILADMDFETYSEAGLAWNPTARRWGPPPGTANKRSISAVGAARYAEHHSTEVLCLKYDLKDGRGRRMWIPCMPDPQDLFDHISAGGLIEAWNVGFERHIWEKVCVPRLGWPPIPRRQYRCAMAKSRAYGLPGSLSAAAAVTNSIEQKDKDGTRLLNKFSTPRNPTKNDGRLRIRPQDDPADAERLYAYCEQDIVAEAVMSSGTPDLEGEELEYWLADQEINARGVQIDVASVRNCIAVIHATHNRYDHEMSALTGGVVSAASEIERLKGWIGAQGLLMPSMDEEAVEAALKRDDLNPLARRALEIRSLVGSASVKKLFAMNLQVCADGRLRDLFSYHATRTGRATGNGPQPTNLPNHGPAVRHCGCCKRHYGLTKLLCPWCGADPTLNGTEVEWNPQAVEDCLYAMNTRSLAIVELYFDEAMAALSGCLRGMFVAREGYDLICSDYSAIEAVVLAELAGEGWRQDVFRTHGKIYEMSASKITGVPFEEFAEHRKRTGQHHPMRKKVGKVAELACFSPDTQVLTDRGYVAIVDVGPNDRLWDGIEWVSHQGVVAKGERDVITLDGVRMTPTHPVSINGSWRAASELASDESTLCQALESGSESLPWSVLNWGIKGGSGRLPSDALAAMSSKTAICRTSGSVSPRGAIGAPSCNPPERLTSNATTNTPLFCQTWSIGADSSIGLPQPAFAAAVRKTACTPITAAAAYGSATNGGQIKGPSSHTASLCLGGTTQRSKWTESTSTEITSPATSGSCHGLTTKQTAAASRKCSGGSTNSSDVYDIVNAGPRHRFTIKTDSGHLLVHNSGYQGWIGAWKAFGADEFFSDDEIKDAILAWRAASPSIVEFWGGQSRNWKPELFGIEGCVVNAILHPGQTFHHRGISYVMIGDALICRLLSGRPLTYHRPRLTESSRRRGEWSISYEGWNTNPKNGRVGWIRMYTWGGRLVENIVQATARDLQRFAILNQEKAGYPIVLHVYDENVAEVPEGWGSVEEFERLMSLTPDWAAGWPVKAAGGWRGKRYRKD